MLVSGIVNNVTGMFDSVNSKVGDISNQVGSTPLGWNSGIFNMIKTLSDNIILPIAGMILAFVMTLELIQMITDHNNMHQIETWMFFKWIFKTACAVLIVSNTWNIVMAVFDVAQSVVSSSSGIITGNTSINLVSHIGDFESRLNDMEVGELIGLYLQSFIVQTTMWALSICIFLITYGRMIEIYLVTSIAPIPMSAMMSREGGGMGQNYLRGAGYDLDIIPSDLATYGNEAKKLLQDLQSRNERMFLVTFIIMNIADTKQKLDNCVFRASSVAQKYNCRLVCLDFRQEEGLMSSLPLGLNQIEIRRGLTTSATAIFVPFTTQELFQNGKVSDNALSTAKTIFIQRSRCILAGISVIVSDFIYFWLTKRIVTSDGIIPIIVVSVAGGIGCMTACIIGEKLSKDRTYVNVIMSDNRIPSNPMLKVERIGTKYAEKEREFWTLDEYTRFSEAIQDRPELYYAFQVLFWCGLRLGELQALKKKDIEPYNMVIHIRNSYSETEKVHGRTKTASSVRTIHIPQELALELQEYMDGIYRLEDNDQVFPLSKWELHKAMTKYSEAAGVKRITIHGLRHSHISLLMNCVNTASVMDIAKRAGHKSPDITMIYAHRYAKKDVEIAEKLNEMMTESET